MSDRYGLQEAKRRNISLGEIGHRVVFENEHVRVWEVKLEPGETIDFHIHYHPYLVISLGGGENEIETIFGDKRQTWEPSGAMVFIEDMQPVHRLTNKSDQTYLSRLVELRHVTWEADEAVQETQDAPSSEAKAPATMPADAMAAFKEYLMQTADMEWVEKSLAGLSHKMLWRNEETGASIALVKFEKGSGIPDAHEHASNQMMYCLSGRYRYIPTGTTLTPGAFYCNPKGSIHGPTIAEDTSVLLEVYDGPHYPVRPSWYSDDEDAR